MFFAKKFRRNAKRTEMGTKTKLTTVLAIPADDHLALEPLYPVLEFEYPLTQACVSYYRTR